MVADANLSPALPSPSHPLAKTGYGKRTADDETPHADPEFAHLNPREREIAVFIDHLDDGHAMGYKVIAAEHPRYGQQAVRTSMRRLSCVGHLHQLREHLTVEDNSMRWVTRTYWSRAAKSGEWWGEFARSRGGRIVTEGYPMGLARAEEGVEEGWEAGGVGGVGEGAPAEVPVAASAEGGDVVVAPSESSAEAEAEEAVPQSRVAAPRPQLAAPAPQVPAPALQGAASAPQLAAPAPQATAPAPQVPSPQPMASSRQPQVTVPATQFAAPQDSAPQNPDPAPEPSIAYLTLAELRSTNPRMPLSAADCRSLEALAEEWLTRGATPNDILRALSDGLPSAVTNPGGFARRRLEDKMPPKKQQHKGALRARVDRVLHACITCDADERTTEIIGGVCKECHEELDAYVDGPPEPGYIPDTFLADPDPVYEVVPGAFEVHRWADTIREATGWRRGR